MTVLFCLEQTDSQIPNFTSWNCMYLFFFLQKKRKWKKKN